MNTKLAMAVFNLEPAAKKIQIFPGGDFRASDTRPRDVKSWVLTEAVALKLIKVIQQEKNPMVIDYNHATMQRGAEAPAAGWVDRDSFEWDNGLVATASWTPRAKEQIDNKEQAFLSPVFKYNTDTGEVTDLLNIGLTNTPAIDGMDSVALKKLLEEKDMLTEAEFAELTKKLGLETTASGPDVLKAVDTLGSTAATKDGLLTKSQEAFATEKTEMLAKCDALKNDVDKVTLEHLTAKAAVTAMKEYKVAMLTALKVDTDTKDSKGDCLTAIEQLKKFEGKVDHASLEVLGQTNLEVVALMKELEDLKKKTATEKFNEMIVMAQREGVLSTEPLIALAKQMTSIESLEAYITAQKSTRPPEFSQTGGHSNAVAASKTISGYVASTDSNLLDKQVMTYRNAHPGTSYTEALSIVGGK